ncbi:MAG TPA: tetratricopeptide repeat protein [Pyrinomonadaceae bacterium]|nr:tetratricopeptide repeat protein [Pyrinomonadaceae bacterium]
MEANRRVSNPFPGLRPFETNEYLLFFGREGQSDALVERLERARFLAVVGTSGSGKSSLVRAGLLPALRGGMMAGAGAGWRVAVSRPGHDPIGNLARELAAEGVLPGDSGLERAEAEAVVEATLRRGSLGLVEAAYAARLGEREKLLVVVDQFEELFRFREARAGAAATDDDAAAFVKLLLEASRQRELPVYVVLTMRSDFLGDCAQFQGLPEAINDGQYLIPRMTRDERRVAIVGPARVARGKMTEPLVNRLLNDVGDNPDQLPILQHALMRTWDFWLGHHADSEPVGLDHYLAVGTMTDALSMHADEAYNELPDERSQRIAELLFKALTERGTDNREVRRPTSLHEICEIAEATPEEVAGVVEVFRREGRSFLMPPPPTPLTPDTVIDISHESLIRNWARLRDWVKDEAEGARIYRRLADAAAAHRAGEGGLLDDVTIGWVNRWRERYKPNRAWGLRYHRGYDEALGYLEESEAASAARATEGERQRQAEFERERRERQQALAVAEQQRRTARRMRWLAAGMGVMFFVALAFAGFAYAAGQRARASEQRARDSERLALNAKTTAENLNVELKKTFDQVQQQKDIAERAAADLQKQKEISDRNAEKALAEKKRADEQARAAARNELAARRAAKAARDYAVAADRARKAAENNAQQAQAAVERGSLIREGLEAFQREDYGEAEQYFDQLAGKLTPLLPGAPRPAGAQFSLTPEQAAAETGWAYSYKGSAYRQAEELDEARKSYEDALEKLKYLKNAHDPILFDTYHGLGHVYHDLALRGYVSDEQGEQQKIDQKQFFDRAREYYRKALDFQLATPAEKGGGDTEEAADENANLARLYRDVGQMGEAEKHFIETVRIRLGRSLGDAGAGALDEKSNAALKELAEFYLGQGKVEDAAQVYDQLIDLEEDTYALEDGHIIADSYSDLGQAYNAMAEKEKDPSKAKELADRSESAFRVANLLQQAVLTSRKESAAIEQDAGPVTLDDRMDELGDAYIKLGRYRQAEQIYTLALEQIRLKVRANDQKRGQSYQKLGDLYNDYLKNPEKAQDYYRMLVQFYEGRQLGSTERLNYAVALDKLGKLYAKDPQTYSGAEERLNAAFKIFAAEGSLNMDSTLAALAELYARQNREAELKQACDRRLDIMSHALAAAMTSPGSGVTTRAARAYIKAAAEVGDLYLSRNRNDWAEEAYAKLFASDDVIRRKVFDLPRLADYAALLEKYKSLLSASNKTAELANVNKALDSIRAKQNELQEQLQVEQSAQRAGAQTAQ